ncbi:MAG: UDP-N-acetylmuramate dehydrogenase [Defluviitaleaceae bacterium]|nr:UDP-N-acetylmuramate dehydrogenase [Defluviitaleaceae bacterium]
MFNDIRQLLPTSLVLANEPMAKHTSFKIGGPAEVFVTPKDTTQLAAIWKTCLEKGYPVTILGGGNNVLVSDDGIKGVVITTTRMNKIQINENEITAGSGTKLHILADTAKEIGLSGLEFAHGIPGTVGGAVFMNAGAYNHETKDVCEKVIAMLPNGEVITHAKESLAFGYRKSRFQKETAIITEAKFRLSPKSPDEIKAYMDHLMTKRRDTQPLDKKSAGSTFKRPNEPNRYAARMIDECGLKGFTIGGAQVSEKHAGFVINTGNATAADVLNLMATVKEKVHAATGIWLEPEMQMLGFM